MADERKHSYWKVRGFSTTCAECGHGDICEYKYCSNCGSIMDEPSVELEYPPLMTTPPIKVFTCPKCKTNFYQINKPNFCRICGAEIGETRRERRMTNEQAIKILSNRDGHGIPSGYTNGYAEAIEVAIKALKAEPKHDLEVVVNEACLNCELDCVEVVRCRDCRNYEEAKNGCNGICKEWDTSTYTWDYCSKGEKNTETLESWNLDGSPTRYIIGRKDGGENV